MYSSFSERDFGILALLDSLPCLESGVLRRSLNLVASLISETVGAHSKDLLRGRFWDVISGEMDVERAQIAVAWWSTGGRERTLRGSLGDEDEFLHDGHRL